MKNRIFLIASALVFAFAGAAHAQPQADSIGTFKAWNAYVSNAPDGRICFVASQPQDSQYSQRISSRNPAFFMVTSIPAKNILNETSTIIGYPFKEASKVVVDIDGQKFSMYTEVDTAWIESEGDEPVLVQAMIKGSKMKVIGTSKRGTITTDTYSLSGVTAALEAAKQACGG